MAVLLQIGSVLALASGAALVSGWSSAWYVVLGGSAAIIPNSLFAMRLALHRDRSPESYPVVFFLGQFAKIGLTAALLAAFHKWLGPLQWLPLLLGLIVALQAPLFALLYVRSQPDHDPAARSVKGSQGDGTDESSKRIDSSRMAAGKETGKGSTTSRTAMGGGAPGGRQFVTGNTPR
ncbi:MAG TPA: ATP synthase subunit I [Mycoplana sp.]|nr:ATP synthase subunit I [Mycoplana sp.]